MSREEEERRKRTSKRLIGYEPSTSASSAPSEAKAKKPAKRRKQQRIDAARTALFSFTSSPDFPEQITMVQNEVVHCIEHCGDGWSMIRSLSESAEKRQGVVPTSYLSKTEPGRGESSASKASSAAAPAGASSGGASGASAGSASSKDNFIVRNIKERLAVLREMAALKLRATARSFVDLTLAALNVVATQVLAGGQKLYDILNRNESYMSILSGASRAVYAGLVGSLVPVVPDAELNAMGARVQALAEQVRAERARREPKPEEKVM